MSIKTNRRNPRVAVALALMSVVGSCRDSKPVAGPGFGEWILAEDLVVGSLDGADGAPTFGLVSEVVGTRDGGAIVVDIQAPAVYRFSPSGEFMHKLGGEGGGPGEYRDVSGVASLPDGRVMVRDPRRALIFYGADGTLESELPVRVDWVGIDPVALVGDAILLRYSRDRTTLETYWRAPNYGFVRVRTPGPVIDTLLPPRYHGDDLYWAPFHPTYHMSWLSDGSLVHGAASAYRIEITAPNGETIGQIERSPERLPIHEEALAYIAEHLAWLERRGNRSAPFYPDPPTVLPAFDRILVSSNDEVWVQSPSSVTSGEVQHRMDVFDRFGAQVGRVRVPPGVEVHSVVGDWLWGVRQGEYDEQYIVRFRIGRLVQGVEGGAL